MRRAVLALALAACPTLAGAQTYAGQDTNSPRSNAIAARTAPGVAAANRAVADGAGPAQSVNPADQAAYAADLRAYDAARRMRRHVINRDRAYYDRQQRAYAMAMADWRAQTAACHRGHNRACRLPTPRPADYM